MIWGDIRLKARWCYGRDDWRAVVKTLLTDGTAAMVWYRAMQWCQRHRLIPLAMVCNKLNAILCQCIIGRGAEFGPGFVLIHSQGVVINGQVRGGSRIFIEHQVTIGAERDQSPLLADDIFLGAGAKVIGPVQLGRQVRVGANAVVVKNVPDGATVGGIPARVLRMRPLSPDGLFGTELLTSGLSGSEPDLLPGAPLTSAEPKGQGAELHHAGFQPTPLEEVLQ
jgi:serine O-acetyltransferase